MPEADLKRYQAQHQYIQQICELYETAPNDSMRLFELVQAMQGCGNPPQEIVDEMSPGLSFDGDGLPNFGGGQGHPDLAKCCVQ